MAAAIAALTLALSACGSSGPEDTPVACQRDSGAYLVALEAAPSPVLLDGETPISACLVPEQGSGDLQDVGQAMIAAATRLNLKARSDLNGPEAVQLGYLVGAVERGAAGTGGIHAELVKRINAAARFNPGGKLLPAAFERTFGSGHAAGRADG